MNKKAILCFLLYSFFFVPLFSIQPVWTKILSAEPITTPQLFENRIFCLTKEGSLHCLDTDGNFLWSKFINGNPFDFSISPEGFIYTVSKTHSISAYNVDGLFLWRLSNNIVPEKLPFIGLDGRIIIPTEKKLFCISAIGTTKWELPLSIQSIQDINHDGNKNIILVTKDAKIIRINPFGQIIEISDIEINPICIEKAADGFFCGFANGMLSYFSTFKKLEKIWTVFLSSPCVTIKNAFGTLIIYTDDGVLYALNPTDGSLLWKSNMKKDKKTRITTLEDYFVVYSNKEISGLSVAGKNLWNYQIQENSSISCVSDGEFFVKTNANWSIQVFRIQTLIKKEKNTTVKENYGILTGHSDTNFLTYYFLLQNNFSFLELVSKNINNGIVGTNEVYYALRLSLLLQDAQETSMHKGRAAHLLGKMGSYEYQPVLTGLVQNVQDASFAIGLLYGIASCAYNPDNTSFFAVTEIAKKMGISQVSVQFATCDALYALARYSAKNNEIILQELAKYTKHPYPDVVQKHALNLLTKMLL